MEDRVRIAGLARAAGAVRAVSSAAMAARAMVTVHLDDAEEFGEPLATEIAEMASRLEQIAGDLSLVGCGSSDDDYWAPHRYRLANRGAEMPDPEEDAAQLAEIEGGRAAA